jgi:DnaJ-class molecular chaperone
MMKCFRCDGRGGYEQLTRVNEDDTAWDICPMCNGTGKDTREWDNKKDDYKDEK